MFSGVLQMVKVYMDDRGRACTAIASGLKGVRPSLTIGNIREHSQKFQNMVSTTGFVQVRSSIGTRNNIPLGCLVCS